MSITGSAVTIVLGLWFAPSGGVEFAPPPDFERPFDYRAWYESHSQSGASNNAYAEYAKFMPGLVGADENASGRPSFSGMLTSGDREEGPIPWEPAEHEAWERSYARSKAVLQRVEEAARLKTFGVPTGLSGPAGDSWKLLLRMKRPHLAPLRQAAEAELEGAWRIDDGRVPAKAIITAVETNLRMARQLEQGIAIADHQAAIGIRRLTYEHIRWAFAHGVLGERDIMELRKTLREIDDSPIDLRPAVRGDHATMMEALQFVFGPDRAIEGIAKLNIDRFRDVTGVVMRASRMAIGARLTTDAVGTARAFDAMYKAIDAAMFPPYDTGHDSQIQDELNKARRFNSVTKAMSPGEWLHHYRTAMQCETQRRAVLTIVEFHAYKAKKGKWPKELATLGHRNLARIGPDPYCGRALVYRMTDDGPMLYSAAQDGRDDGGAHNDQWLGLPPGSDFVFWPIPGGSKLVAEVKLRRIEQSKVTAISDIDASMVDREVTVVARVSGIEARPSRKHERRYNVTLSEGEASILLYYYEDIAKLLSAKQAHDVGQTIRMVAIVRKNKDELQLELRDADYLAVEE